MKIHFMLCALAVGVCGNAAEKTFDFEVSELRQSAQPLQAATPMQAHLCDVMEVYGELVRVHAAYRACADAPLNEAACAEVVKAATQRLRPLCARLRALPPDELRQLCLLADAIEWQANWVRDTYKSTHAETAIQPYPRGLEIVAELSESIMNKLSRASTSQEHMDALLELLSLFGGVDYLPLPRCLLNHRIAKDYKTAYNFFEEFRAACALTDDAACINRLNELMPVLDYLLQGGEADRIRVGFLAYAYSTEMPGLKLIIEMRDVEPATETSAMKRHAALQPFFEKLPELESFFTTVIRMHHVDKW